MGSAHYKRGDPDAAMSFFNRSKHIREELGLEHTAGYATLMDDISQCRLEQDIFP